MRDNSVFLASRKLGFLLSFGCADVTNENTVKSIALQLLDEVDKRTAKTQKFEQKQSKELDSGLLDLKIS